MEIIFMTRPFYMFNKYFTLTGWMRKTDCKKETSIATIHLSDLTFPNENPYNITKNPDTTLTTKHKK